MSASGEQRVFLWAAAASVVTVVGFVAWVTFRVGGDSATIAVDDIGEAVAAWGANNPTSKVIGTGLGLPMARQIVEMHGGRIWFESQLGLGSEFHFSLPAQTKSAAPPKAPIAA
ncbi:MAG TPA: HAMP domain-containing sensor histidine kinase [Candidatus Baltobacterales bacterium]|nr:HAMP domain-containing sensor histidine kinase [Candidatus Baltobacterales bacterium]